MTIAKLRGMRGNLVSKLLKSDVRTEGRWFYKVEGGQRSSVMMGKQHCIK